MESEYTLSKIAAFFKISKTAVHNWFQTQVPAERCPDLEWFFHKQCTVQPKANTVEKLRPDLKWVRFPDRRWPHPKGRPCLDLSTSR